MHTYKDTIAGYHLHYRAIGEGTPLVLIHGYGVSGHIWDPMLPYLAQYHQVFVIDLPGYGRSRLAPASQQWQLRAMAPLLAEWLRCKSLPPAALMGQSMGGAIAIHLAAYAPELVDRLILVSAAGIPLKTTLPVLVLRSVRSLLQSGNGGYPLPLVRDVLQPRLRLFWQGAQEVLASDFRAELAALKTPTLIVWGEQDLLLPIALGYELYKALPHAVFVTIPKSGHRPMLAEPEMLSGIVLEFLQEKDTP